MHLLYIFTIYKEEKKKLDFWQTFLRIIYISVHFQLKPPTNEAYKIFTVLTTKQGNIFPPKGLMPWWQNYPSYKSNKINRLTDKFVFSLLEGFCLPKKTDFPKCCWAASALGLHYFSQHSDRFPFLWLTLLPLVWSSTLPAASPHPFPPRMLLPNFAKTHHC